jgi:HAD superfamily phosphatase (TIGR01668 family)
MGRLFYPDVYFSSAYNIEPQFLKNHNITNLIVDIDNTLSKWGSKEPDVRVCEWIKTMRNHGFNICILSNSSNRRVKKYCLNLDVTFVKNVRKPLRSSFNKAVKLLGGENYNTCVIGDQIFTDILGGNSCRLFTILVAPIDKNEFLLTRILRKIENRIIGGQNKDSVI